jgi:hypothetical protein
MLPKIGQTAASTFFYLPCATLIGAIWFVRCGFLMGLPARKSCEFGFGVVQAVVKSPSASDSQLLGGIGVSRTSHACAEQPRT